MLYKEHGLIHYYGREFLGKGRGPDYLKRPMSLNCREALYVPWYI